MVNAFFFVQKNSDLPNAYDNISHPLIANRLAKRGFSTFFTAAILRENPPTEHCNTNGIYLIGPNGAHQVAEPRQQRRAEHLQPRPC